MLRFASPARAAVRILVAGIPILNGSCRAALSHVAREQFDLAILLLPMADGLGGELIDGLRRGAPSTRVIVSRMDESLPTPLDALDRGAYAHGEDPTADIARLLSIIGVVSHASRPACSRAHS